MHERNSNASFVTDWDNRQMTEYHMGVERQRWRQGTWQRKEQEIVPNVERKAERKTETETTRERPF